MLAFVLCALVVAALCWVTVSPRDAWPFSSYPMFARPWSDPSVRFYRLRFVLPDGSHQPLPTSMGRLADDFHREFEAVWRGTATLDPRAIPLIERYRELAARSHPKLGEAPKIEIFVALVQLGAKQGAVSAEQWVLTHEIAAGARGRG